MRQTLFSIPIEVFGAPLFGWGVLLAIWVILSGGIFLFTTRKVGWTSDSISYLAFIAAVGAVIVWGLPGLVERDGVPIRGYGVMMLLAVVSGVALAIYRARKVGLTDEAIYSLALWMVFPGIVGARLFYVIEYWQRDFRQPKVGSIDWFETLKAVFRIHEGGLVVFGSLIGALLGLFFFVRRFKLPVFALADVVAPSMALGLALGRIGCFLNGCCYGGACELPWAVRFPANSAPFQVQLKNNKINSVFGLTLEPSTKDSPVKVKSVEPSSTFYAAGLRPGMQITKLRYFDAGISGVNGGKEGRSSKSETTIDFSPGSGRGGTDFIMDLVLFDKPGTPIELNVDNQLAPISWTYPSEQPRSNPIHPTQIYSAIDALVLCIFLCAITPYIRYDGQLLAITLMVHAVARYLLEIIRIDEANMFNTGMSISQIVGIGLFAGGAALFYYVTCGPLRNSFRVARAA